MLSDKLAEAVEWDRQFGSGYKLFDVCKAHGLSMMLTTSPLGVMAVLQDAEATGRDLAVIAVGRTAMDAAERAVEQFVAKFEL